MATISRTGIAGGGTISPAHITNIIDALDGSSSTTTVVASGSFSGSLTGHATSATTATTATSASYVLQAVSASFAVSASYAPSTGVTINNNTNNNLVTATGTANTLNGEATLTFNGSTLGVDYAKITLKEVINDNTQSIQLATDEGYLSIGRANTEAAFQVYDYNTIRQVKIGDGNILDVFMTNYTFGVSGSSTFKGNTKITGSLSVSGSLNVTAGITGSLLGTASYATQALSASYAPGAGSTFPYTGSAIISGSLRITGSLNVSAGIATPQFTINAANTASAGTHLVLDLNLIGKSGGTGQFIVPSSLPSVTPAAGTLYWDDANSALYIYQSGGGGGWRNVLLT